MRTDRLRETLRRTPREPAACALDMGATGGIGEAFAREMPPDTNLVLTGRMTRDALDELAGAMADALGRDEAWANGEAERCAAMPTILFRPGELREMAA